MADEPIDLAAAREKTLEAIRKEYPPLLTSAHVAELMQCTIWEVRDQVHRGELPAVRWGQQFRFFRDEVIAAMVPVSQEVDAERDQS